MKSYAVKWNRIMSNIVIRLATRTDLDRLTFFLNELFSIETDFVIDIDKQKNGLELLFRNPKRSVIIVAEMDDIVVGMVTGQLVISTAIGGYSILLEDMFVVKEHRRLHLGAMLVDGLKSWGVDKGAKRIQLVADRDNSPALKFYCANGFSQGKMVALYRNLVL